MSNFSNDNSFTNSAARETGRSLWLCTHKIFCLELCHLCLERGKQLCSVFSLQGYIGANKICRITRLYRAMGASQRISENSVGFFSMLLFKGFQLRYLYLCIAQSIFMLYYLSIFGNGWGASIGQQFSPIPGLSQNYLPVPSWNQVPASSTLLRVLIFYLAFLKCWLLSEISTYIRVSLCV